MGLICPQARMLCEARRRGASFDSVLTVGHLSIYLHPAELRLLRSDFPPIGPLEQRSADYAFGAYSDAFFRDFLAAGQLSILDASDYEGATLIHDLNEPVPSELYGRFDSIVDGGSLEHVFNFPVAVANLMRMTKPGGSLFIGTPANNLCGHGFYQFSPELMFRVFSPANGFELREVQLVEAEFPVVELTPARGSFRVSDPAEIGRRVMLTSRRPVMMLVEAQKTADVVPFSAAPQQSDYVVAWQSRTAGAAKVSLRRRLAERLPRGLRNRLRGYWQRRQFSLSNRSFYQKLPQ